MKTVLVSLVVVALATSALGVSWNCQSDKIASAVGALAFMDDNNGVAGMMFDGHGSRVKATNDGGQTWWTVPAQNVTRGWAGGAVSNDGSVVFIGDNRIQWSNGGAGQYNFRQSSLGTETDIMTNAGIKSRLFGFYVLAGSSKPSFYNGIAISHDSGRSFAFTNITTFQVPIYDVAVPTAYTWYAAGGGQWDLYPYNGQIVKTNDAGRTWTTVYWAENQFNFQNIECERENANHCCVIAKASSGSKSGLRIFCTFNGGQTWNQTSTTYSLNYYMMTLQFVDANNIWITGGLSQGGSYWAAWIWQSADGGKSWTAKQWYVPGQNEFINIITFPSPTHGYATSSIGGEAYFCSYQP
jgi:photosystem II stability/assembly factor-like uncharacterized protein